MKWLVLLATLLLALPADAQLMTTGVGPGKAGGGGAAGYVGPGDLVTWVSWSGFRCFSSTYVGNVADVWDAATGTTTETLITCTAGGVLNETVNPLATTCAVACKIKTLYDQSGNTNCGGAACAVTGASAARPTLTLNASPHSHYCGIGIGSTTQILTVATGVTVSQPLTVSFVAKRTANFTSLQTPFALGNVGQGFNGSANQIYIYAGTVVGVTAADSVLHAIQVVYNGSSSTADVDGVTTSSLNPGTNATSGTYSAYNNSAATGQTLNGVLCEFGVVSGAMSGPNQAALTTNQLGFW